MKKFFAGIILGAVLFTGISVAASSNFTEITMKFFMNGEEKQLKYGNAVNINDRVYVPLRDAAEWLDTSIYWNSTSISLGSLYSEIIDTNGKTIGGALFVQEEDSVVIKLSAENLSPGKHGFHIHTQQFSGHDFSTAAGHFNPEGKKHGLNSHEGHHLGDMPNIEVQSDGTVVADLMVPGVTLEAGKTNSILGKSLIIHAGEDYGLTDPAGNAGDRVAGGNIGQ